MKHPRSAFGAPPRGGPFILRYRRTTADRQSRIRGGRLMRLFHAIGVPHGAVENRDERISQGGLQPARRAAWADAHPAVRWPDVNDFLFALLDDADATPERPSTRLCTGFVREHRCTDPATLDAVCAAVQADLAGGLHGVLLADYEWGAKLMRAGRQTRVAGDRSNLRVLMFDTLQRLDAAAAAAWLAAQEGRDHPAPAGVMDLQPDIGRADFDAAIARIHEAIADGETYQVNYTYRLHGAAWGEPIAPVYRPRGPASSAAIHSIVRCFGAPVIEPQGNSARSRPARSTSSRRRDSMVEVIWNTVA